MHKILLPDLLWIILLILFLSSCNSNPSVKWITCNNNSNNSFENIYLRKIFQLNQPEDSFIIEISAQQRYKLFVNGEYAGMGPQISDPEHPRHDRYDINSFLTRGNNLIAAELINFGPYSGSNMFPGKTALWLRCKQFPEINSSSSWKCYRNENLDPLKVKGNSEVRGGFLAPSCDSLVNIRSIKGWYEAGFDDKNWENAKVLKTSENDPEERTIPYLERRKTGFGKILRGEDQAGNFSFTDTSFSFRVAPESAVSVLIDNNTLTTGFPEMINSGGLGSEIKIGYAESLYFPG
jgi:hypothetical protein